MSDALIAAIPHEVYSDLLGVPFAEHGRTKDGMDCYGLVAEMFRRCGSSIPDHRDGVDAYLTPAEEWSWTPIEQDEPGAMGLLSCAGRAHVCYSLGDGLCIESLLGVGVTVQRSAGRGFRWLRWSPGDGAPVPQLCAGFVTVVELDPNFSRTVRLVPWRDGLTIADIAPNGVVMSSDLADGGLVLAVTCPGFHLIPALAATAATAASAAAAAAATAAAIAAANALLVNILISAALTGLSMLLQPAAPEIRDTQEGADNNGYFDLHGLRNTSGIGFAQAMTYGEMRVAGHIVGAFQRAVENGALDTATLHLLISFGVGPYQQVGKNGTADADNIPAGSIGDDIKIDGNPASSLSATTASLRLGNNDQNPVPEFSHTVQSVSYSNQFDGGESFVHVMTDAVDRYDVHIAFPQGLYSISTNGNQQAQSVTHTIEHRITGTTTWSAAQSFTTTRSKRSPFLVSLHMFPAVKAKYDVRITRVTAWPTSNANTVNASTLWGINEITHSSVALVGRPLLGLSIVGQDQLTSAIPNVTAVVKGRKIWTWSTGAWVDNEAAATQHSWPTSASEAQLQGTATSGNINPQFVYCDNPAMVLLDVLLDSRTGMGRNGRITLANIDMTSFVAWAAYCDTMVSDGRGGTTRRARFAGTIDSSTSGWEWITQVAGSHWGRIVAVGNKIKVVVDKVTTPIYAFSAANVRDVAVQYHGRANRPNTIEVQYLNRENEYEPDIATKSDDNALFVNNEAQVRETVQAVGVVRASQAYRLAQSRANFAKLSTQSLAFTAGPESVHLLPGDVIWFGHDCIQAGTGGRILAATSTTVTLDHSLTVSGGTGRITCRTNGDTIEERTLTNGTYARGAAITITVAWTNTPSAGAPYLAGAATTYRKTFRIETIDTEADLTRKITASLYSDSIYSDDPGVIETFTDDMPDPRAIPTLPGDVAAYDASTLCEDGSTDPAVAIEWAPSAGWDSVHLFLREVGQEAWQSRGRYYGGEALLCCGITRGTEYEVSVVPVGPRGNALGGPDAGVRRAVSVAGGAGVPADPAALTVSLIESRIVATLAAPSARAHSYEWRYGETWAGSVKICETPYHWLDIVPPFGSEAALRVKAKSASGVYSASESTQSSIRPSPMASVSQLDLSTVETGFTGTKTNVNVSGSSVLLSGSALTGTYETASLVPYLDGQRQSIRVDAICGLQATHYRWDDACFVWGSAHASDTWAAPHMTGHEYERGLTWDQHGESWGCDHASFANWGDTQDFLAALTPTVQVKENGGSFASFVLPHDNSALSSLAVKVTLNRPHTRYDPEIKSITTRTLHYSMTEPERITYEFTAGSATGVGGVVHGFNDSTSSGNTLKVPTGKILTILSAIGVVTTGTTAGTYTGSVILRNITDSVNVTLASASTTSLSTRLHIRADGTRIAPLGTLTAGKEFQVGWLNGAGSPGALTSTNHHVRIVAIEETA